MTLPHAVQPSRRIACHVAAGILLAVVSAGAAHAADWLGDIPVLRGSYGGTDWSGFVIGGHVGVGNMDTDFGNASRGMVSYILRNTTIENEQHPEDWTTLPNQISHFQSYGGFIGYNVQWGQVVMGIDGAYNRVSGSQATASDSISRQFSTSDNFTNNLTIDASSSMKLNDYGTVRGRVGYAFGQFLPYATIGAAVGRFDYSTTVTVIATGSPNAGASGSPYSLNQTMTESKNNAIVAGFEAGLGMDVALTPNIFLRGEWEFIAFAAVNGIRSNINTARAGIGLKF